MLHLICCKFVKKVKPYLFLPTRILGDPSKRIAVSTVKSVLEGHQTNTFKELIPRKVRNNKNANEVEMTVKIAAKKNRLHKKELDAAEDKCFSITFKDHSPPLDLLAEDISTRNMWVGVTQHVFNHPVTRNIHI